MHNYKNLITAIFLAITLVNCPLVVFAQIYQTNSNPISYTEGVLASSPGALELQNGTVLYTKAINTVSPQGKEFASQHAVIANETIQDVNQLTYKLFKTRDLNRNYMDSLGIQLNLWKQLTKRDPSLQPVLNRELQVFNKGISLQLQENLKWAVIDGILKELNTVQDYAPPNESLIKSLLYTDLIRCYADLNDFYKLKYKELITLSTLSHAAQENPRLNIPAYVLDQVKPLHANELNAATNLIYDLDDNFKGLQTISSKAKELNDLYNDIDKYSLSELNALIKNLESQVALMKANQDNKPYNASLIAVVNGYLNYYKALKKQLENKILAYEITESTLIAAYEKDPIKLAYAGTYDPGLLYSGLSDWASWAASGVASGARTAAGAAYAVADYTTGKAADTIFSAADTASAIYNKGLFSKEYETWSNAYDKAGETNYTVSIRDTFINPIKATMSGDSKNALGQAAIVKAQSSFSQFDKYAADATGSQFISQVALNVVTAGGYGLSKDFTTINDARASTADQIAAGVGIVLNIAPILSGARAANQGARAAANTIKDSTIKAAEEIAEVAGTAKGANAALNQAYDALVNARTELIQAGGPQAELMYATSRNIKPGPIKSAVENLDAAASNYYAANQAFSNAQQELAGTVVENIGNTAKNTFSDGVKGAVNGFVEDHGLNPIINRFQDLYSRSLGDAIKNAEPFFGNTVGGTLGVREIANFGLSNFFNESLEQVITDTTKNVLSTPPNQPGGQQGPATTYNQGGPNNPSGSQVDLNSVMQYLDSRQPLNSGNSTNVLDDSINMIQTNQQSYNQGRGPNSGSSSYDPNIFNTDPSSSNNFGNQGLTNYVNQQSQQTSGWGNNQTPCNTQPPSNTQQPLNNQPPVIPQTPNNWNQNQSSPCNVPCK